MNPLLRVCLILLMSLVFGCWQSDDARDIVVGGLYASKNDDGTYSGGDPKSQLMWAISVVCGHIS